MLMFYMSWYSFAIFLNRKAELEDFSPSSKIMLGPSSQVRTHAREIIRGTDCVFFYFFDIV